MLNKDQEEGFNFIKNFLKPNNLERVISISGGAGTGKSYLIEHIRKNFPNIVITATTNEAAALIHGTTIHKYLGFGIKQKKEYRGSYIKGRPILIDEASMCPVHILKYILELGEKIILVGDANQLTVGFTVNLNDYPTKKLTINMRAKTLDIKKLVDHLDMCVEKHRYPDIREYASENIIFIENHKKFKQLISENKNKNSIVLSYKNTLVQKYYDIHEQSLSVHKAQGKTFKIVFLDARDIISSHTNKANGFNHPIDKTTYLRLISVGLSRAQEKIYIFTGEKRIWKE